MLLLVNHKELNVMFIKNGKTTLQTMHTPLNVIKDLALRRLAMSYDYTMKYIMENYSGPKKFISNGMLPLVRHYPGKANIVFNLMSYISFGGVVFYGIGKNIGR